MRPVGGPFVGPSLRGPCLAGAFVCSRIPPSRRPTTVGRCREAFRSTGFSWAAVVVVSFWLTLASTPPGTDFLRHLITRLPLQNRSSKLHSRRRRPYFTPRLRSLPPRTQTRRTVKNPARRACPHPSSPDGQPENQHREIKPLAGETARIRRTESTSDAIQSPSRTFVFFHIETVRDTECPVLDRRQHSHPLGVFHPQVVSAGSCSVPTLADGRAAAFRREGDRGRTRLGRSASRGAWCGTVVMARSRRSATHLRRSTGGRTARGHGTFRRRRRGQRAPTSGRARAHSRASGRRGRGCTRASSFGGGRSGRGGAPGPFSRSRAHVPSGRAHRGADPSGATDPTADRGAGQGPPGWSLSSRGLSGAFEQHGALRRRARGDRGEGAGLGGFGRGRLRDARREATVRGDALVAARSRRELRARTWSHLVGAPVRTGHRSARTAADGARMQPGWKTVGGHARDLARPRRGPAGQTWGGGLSSAGDRPSYRRAFVALRRDLRAESGPVAGAARASDERLGVGRRGAWGCQTACPSGCAASSSGGRGAAASRPGGDGNGPFSRPAARPGYVPRLRGAAVLRGQGDERTRAPELGALLRHRRALAPGERIGSGRRGSDEAPALPVAAGFGRTFPS